MFEIYGTWRARSINKKFLYCKTNINNGGPAIDYLHTGIIKGKWLAEIQSVFVQHGVEVDYTKRGFYCPKPVLLNKLDVGLKLLYRPDYFVRQILL